MAYQNIYNISDITILYVLIYFLLFVILFFMNATLPPKSHDIKLTRE